MVKLNLSELKKIASQAFHNLDDSKAQFEFGVQFNPILVLHLLDDLDDAVQYLKQGKAKFTPNTTNSDVDYFLEKYE